MKRCSECHFTFADHEEVCDFDGTQLTLTPEPALHEGMTSSGLRRLVQSHGLVVVLTLIALGLSALLVGYYDALDQAHPDAAVDVTIPQSNFLAQPLPQATSNPSSQRRSINTQRRISADGKPELGSFAERSQTRARRYLSSSPGERTTAQLQATAKRATVKRKTDPDSFASPGGDRKGTSGSNASTRRESVAEGRRQFEQTTRSLAHHKKDSKFVAALKTTGRILKWPFQF
jgi:hypothetical protein